MGLDLNAYHQKFPDICKDKFGRTYDFPSIEKRFAPLREGKRWLVANDVAQVFLPQNTPFGRYWPQPNEKDLDRALACNRILVGPVPQGRQELILRLLKAFHNIGVASLILRFVHPDHFGVFSTPVLHLVHVNRGATVELYFAYCDELATWANHFRVSYSSAAILPAADEASLDPQAILEILRCSSSLLTGSEALHYSRKSPEGHFCRRYRRRRRALD